MAPFAALVTAVVVYLVVLGSSGANGKDVMYVTEKARLRTCASTRCPASETYGAGRQLVVERVVRGERVNDSPEWLEVAYGDETRFVASGLVQPPLARIGRTLELAFVLLAGAAVLVNLWVLQSGRLRSVARRNTGPFDTMLFSGVLTVGLLLGVVAFVLSHIGGESLTGFLAGALANLGAGLVGAAVTFALFTVLLSERNLSADDLRMELAELRADLQTQRDPAVTEEPRPRRGSAALATALVILWFTRRR